ncbi:hypothetical protein [Brevibacillus laterosporus]|uniref:Uncharacterized protein n=1 Tax=Brevibacillus laterosporus TaxID=1465 RepID=A0AAP3DKY7_BRELA|nr:hypothetical protein [Brevibacillus laterosporus]MCR8983208.1 hypothetical protein [Brevibacillus laterosporus]MCZ0810364.1 hypothetical protein [Brevibacillus laterosporus]MCZ0828252.1 hypothetical protein [Brevibacillus laterosporus]MCZ0853098.1 hypothetical protein [Brevibacillus laterosporus]NKQ20660.1 hypothetical protein [Brevibacillus laterosporus]
MEKKQIKVRAIESFEVYSFNDSELLGKIDEGEELIADLHEETEEYFTNDKEGREVYVGELDSSGQLQLEDCFVLI